MPADIPVLNLDTFTFRDINGITILNHVLKGNNRITRPHKHDFYLFFLIDQSSGSHTIDFVEHPVSDQQIHVLLPGQVHHWNLDAATTGFQLMISEAIFQSMINYLSFSPLFYFRHPVLSLPEHLFRIFYHEFQQLDEELRAPCPNLDIIYTRSKLIVQLLGKEQDTQFESIQKMKSNPLIIRYTTMVNEQFRDQRSVAYYAKQLNITPNYLNILCKRFLYASANELIQKRLILEAKRLLGISGKSIKEIAYDLGFYDTANFSNFFKSQTGVAPKAFREHP
ncbi:AraC family transcriptional regulator [Niabella sp.]|uniref:helix-turn-helix domain-containing protein n=1 Tax=Niabella sp. TaxID=1962976 RepID=UPI002632BCA8|nr:helix-turn-helix transcriptional regulator [Niabella sp.]